jgi:hypothetical protein
MLQGHVGQAPLVSTWSEHTRRDSPAVCTVFNTHFANRIRDDGFLCFRQYESPRVTGNSRISELLMHCFAQK